MIQNLLNNFLPDPLNLKIDDELFIVGRFAQISLVDGWIDVFLIGEDGQPLSKRKRSAIIKKFPEEVHFVKLTDREFIGKVELEKADKHTGTFGACGAV